MLSETAVFILIGYEPLEGAAKFFDLCVVHNFGISFIIGPGIRNFIAPSIFFFFSIKEGVFSHFSPLPRPVFSVFSDALMSEEKSIIAEFTSVELATELDISYLDKLALEFFWFGPGMDFEDG